MVGINMVQPEDGEISMRDYDLHMQMINFLHRLYPSVHISLHAGELVPGLVKDDGLRFHIRDAVEIAHAERIGHGVDITYETNVHKLLKEMAKKHVAIEISLTSNALILDVSGKNHPLPLYMNAGVPLTLSTDDEGVDRTNMTAQYDIAASTFQLPYAAMKTFSRNAITYSFLPGDGLWSDYAYQDVAPACKFDKLGSDKASVGCQHFLSQNEKARTQWDLEKRFFKFESGFSNQK
jgi:adenosine deaminase